MAGPAPVDLRLEKKISRVTRGETPIDVRPGDILEPELPKPVKHLKEFRKTWVISSSMAPR